MKKIRFIDLFCGIGGFRLGFDPKKFQCVWSSDFNQQCQDIYEENFGDRPFGDITKVDPTEIPDFDILTGGFPCQPFSISGKKLGFNDTRGTLFFDICRIISQKKPKIVILENVRHFVNHDKKRTFIKVIQSLQELGYNVTWKVLNVKDFGLPQNRERIFIIGTRKGIFRFDKISYNISKPIKYFLDKNIPNSEFLKKEEYTLLDKNLVKVQEKSGLVFCGYRNKGGFKRGIRPNTEHLNRVHRQPNRIYSTNGYHPTLPSQEPSGRFFIYDEDNDLVRKLTISECYRIMGFPENFKRHPISGTQYKQIGNSVGVNVIKEISNQIIKQGLLNKTLKYPLSEMEMITYCNHESH